eukprot:Gb_39044 [translate_table: standard]
MDPSVGETCRYLDEAHVNVFDEAKNLYQHSLNMHKEHITPTSLEESIDRRLMALIYDGKGDYEEILEHLVLASMAMISNGMEVASVDCSFGDTYLSLGRYDEVIFAYHKSLAVFKSIKGENHLSIVVVFFRLVDLYYKIRKLRESKTYCESALRIYGNLIARHLRDDIKSGLTEVSVIYKAMNEPEKLFTLSKRLSRFWVMLLESAVVGIEEQMGVI